MGTSSCQGLPKEDLGIIPRVIFQLFELMKSKEKTHIYMLNLSFLEIYNGRPDGRTRGAGREYATRVQCTVGWEGTCIAVRLE